MKRSISVGIISVMLDTSACQCREKKALLAEVTLTVGVAQKRITLQLRRSIKHLVRMTLLHSKACKYRTEV